MDEGSILQEKFFDSDKVLISIFDAGIISPEWAKKDKILAIVQNSESDEAAVFSLYATCRPIHTFSDLSIEYVFPIDNDFKCEIIDSPANTSEKLHLTLITSKLKVTFELKTEAKTSTFVDLLFWAIDTAKKHGKKPNFSWLKKYYNSNNMNGSPDNSPEMIPRQSMLEGHSLVVRENRIKYEMLLKERKFTYTQTIQIFTGTWNVNEQLPIPLDEWLHVDGEPPDIYAVGFQELDALTETLLFDQTPREDIWYEAVVLGLDKREKYVKVERVRLMGIMLLVFAKESLHQHIKNIVSATVGTGIMGRLGNKGGVSIRFDLHNTSMCFVNCHLAAHVEEYERRNQDFHDICSRTQFFIANDAPKGIKDHDQIYWIGDLNYRITELDPTAVKVWISSNNYESLLQWDQLKKQHQAHVVFVGFKEGPINFQPTYKYDPGTNNWDSSEKNRAPAWCDRILWKGDQITQTTYKSHMSLDVSDHKPVSATFKAVISVIDVEKHQKVYEEVIKKLDKLENELIPQVMVDQTEINFGTVKYLEPVSRTLIVANTGQVAAQFEFIKKLQDDSFCKAWLTVEPPTKCISPGEACEISLEVFINKNFAFKFNSGEDRIYDILVLHLEGGKDIFITIDGVYEKSCFGCSMESLVRLREPMKHIPISTVIEIESKRQSVSTPDECYAIPKEIWFLVNHLCVNGLKEPNLFMQPGLHSEVLQIRDWLDNGCTYNLKVSIHSYAEALLLLLESAADPLIPYNLHSVCLNASSNYLQCKQIINQLPELRKNIFMYLCEFLREVLLNNKVNCLDIKTICTLFGAVFLREVPNRSTQNRTKEIKQSLDKKKANFVHHFVMSNTKE